MKRILLLSLLLLPIVALAQYPTFSNKQKLGVQTTGDGLIFRGNSNPNYNPSNINNAYFYLDTTLSKLYLYNVGTWQLVYPTPQFDTTTLNVYLKISDTTAMLLPYFRDSDTTSLNLINRFALKLNISDTATMLTPYMKKADTISLSNKINLKLNISDTTILSNRITTNASNIITINNKLATKLDTIYVKFKNVVTMIENKDTINIGSSLTDGYAINIIGDSVNIDTVILDNRYSDRDSTNELQDITFATTSGIVTISGGKVMNLDTLYNSLIDSVNLLIRDSIAAFTPLTEGYGINIIGDSINVDTNIIFIQSDTITLSNRINTKLDTIYVNYQTSIDTIVNKDTINITKLEAGTGINITNNIISLDTTLLDSVVRVQNVYVKNGTGTVLNKGEAVYVTGANGTNIIVGRASNVAESSSSKTLGLTMTSIPIDGFGYVIKEGLLSGLNTSAADSAGVPIWLSNTPGGLIFGLTNKPYAPNHLVYLGVVTRKQQNNGEVYVTVQNGFEIKELHDVQIIDPVNKASLYYNSSQSLWRDTTAALLVSDTTSMLSKYVNTYSNQIGINGDKTFNNVITIDSATVTGKLLVNTNISDAVKISSNTNSTNLELTNSNGTVSIKSSNKNMILQTDTTALIYLNGENNKVGILTMNPEQALEVAGTIRVDSLVNNLTPDKLVGANNANDLTDIKIGNGLSFLNDTLKVDDNIINSGDTATLLRQDFIPLTSNQVIWTQGNKKLLPYFTQVYRNGQLLKDVQYTISSDSIVTLEEGSYKLGDIITVIAIDNIVALAGSGSMITLQGDITGNGTNSITTTIGVGKVTNSMLAGSISDSKLNTITTAGKISNSATTATSSNTNNAIVTRDNSGNFSAGIITASLNGNANTVTSVLPSNFASQTANTVLAAPNSSNGTPTFRSLVSSDIPNLNYLPLTGGTLTGGLSGTSINLSSTINSIGDIFFGSSSSYSGLKTRYFKTTDVSPNRDLFIGSVGTIGTWAGRMHFQTSYNTETPTTAMTINEFGNINMNGTLGVTSNITANSFIKSGGTSSQFLKADGSVDNNTYLTTSSASSTYLPLTGGTLTGGLTGTTGTFTGNFGIGTTTPLNLFEVSKNNNGTSTSLRITNSFSATGSIDEATDIDFYQGSGSGYFTSGRLRSFREGDYLTSNLQVTGGLSFWTQSSNVTPSNGFTEKMRITAGGNIGIGTATPSFKLDVNGSLGVNGGAVINGTGGNNDTRIESDNNTNMFFVDASENTVGIGTNTPSYTLDVNGSLALNGTLWNFNNVNNRNGYLYFDHSGVQVWKFGLFNDNTSTLSLGNGGNFNRIFNITNNGNIGINDTTPSYTLDVNGTLNATGATTLNNGLNITGTTNILNGQPFSTLNIIPAPTIGSTDNTIQTINTTGLSFKIGTTERMKLNSSGLLTVTDAATFNSSAVFNESSLDADFRVESVGNANMVFVDASANRVGIGTNAPTKTLDVNGEVRINTVTATPTSLLGKDGSNVVGTVTTVAQTGLMTRGVTTFTVSGATATFDVTHSLGVIPETIIITSNAINASSGIFYEIVAKTDNLFTVQGFNVSNGSPAINKTLSVNWLAIK